MTSMQMRRIWFWSFVSAAILSTAGIKVFSAWPQVSDLWDSDVSLVLLVGHPHFFRFLTSYPGFLLEEYWPGLGFTLYISAFFALNVALWVSLVKRASLRIPGLLSWSVFIIAHMAMNGRGVIAWSAWLLCVQVCIDLELGQGVGLKRLLRAGLACFLAAVSTGVFVVVLVALVTFFARRKKLRRERRSWGSIITMVVVAAPILMVALDYLMVAVSKNLTFFGGGLYGAFNMLQHGLGAVFVNLGTAGVVALLALLPLGFLFGFLAWAGQMRSGINNLVVLPVLGGAFGFTVLTLAIPLLLCKMELMRKSGPRKHMIPSPGG